MDTFGRLPNDVIKNIMALYQLPMIDVVIENNKIYMIINYLLMHVKILIYNVHMYINVQSKIADKKTINDKIDDFIYRLNHDMICYYDTDFFKINVNGVIIINYADCHITLTMESKKILIDAIIKYKKILNQMLLYTHFSC